MLNLKFKNFSTPQALLFRKIFLDFALGILVSMFIFKTFTIEVPVFGFHGVFTAASAVAGNIRNFDYPKEELKLFLENLLEKNYWFLSTQELYDYFISENNQTIPPEHQKEKPVLVSFDDGYKNAHDSLMAILPELEERYDKKIKIVFFINPGFIRESDNSTIHANCQNLRDGFAKGYYDLQSHGQNHEDLTKITLDKAESELSRAQKQLKACVQDLDIKGEVANHFAYPFGATNLEVEKLTAKYYKSAYLYNSRTFRPLQNKDNYRLSRLTVNRQTSLQTLKIKAGGFWF